MAVLGEAARAEGFAGFDQELSRCITESNQRADPKIEIIAHGARQGTRIVAEIHENGSPGGRDAYRGRCDQAATACLGSAATRPVAVSAAARPCFTALV